MDSKFAVVQFIGVPFPFGLLAVVAVVERLEKTFADTGCDVQFRTPIVLRMHSQIVQNHPRYTLIKSRTLWLIKEAL